MKLSFDLNIRRWFLFPFHPLIVFNNKPITSTHWQLIIPIYNYL